MPLIVRARLIASIGLLTINLLTGSVSMAGEFEQGLEAARKGDFKSAQTIWLSLAAKGDVNAQYNIGAMYAQGDGVPQDQTEALKWWRKAAEAGYAAAQNQLGYAYTYGEGVELNLTEGIHWFLLAAQQGNPIAQANLGAAYGEGKGAQQNWQLSTKYYQLSADQGFPLAQSNLGVAYMNGHGVQRDFVEAYKWLALAWHYTPASDSRGREIIATNLEQLSKHMTKEQVDLARARADAWRQPQDFKESYKPR